MQKNASMKIYDFNLSAGGSQWLPVTGQYYKIISATGSVSVKEDVGATVGPIIAGQGMKDRDFGGLTIADTSGAPNVGKIIVASSDFVDQVMQGQMSVQGMATGLPVYVTDGGRQSALGTGSFGKAYAAALSVGAGGAGNFGLIQLWNPVGSTVTLYVDEFLIQMPNGQGGLITAAFGQLANAGFAGASKNAVNGITLASQATTRSAQTNAAPSGVASMRMFGSVGADYVWTPKTPVVVPPGSGVTISANSANAGFSAQFQWTEV